MVASSVPKEDLAEKLKMSCQECHSLGKTEIQTIWS